MSKVENTPLTINVVESDVAEKRTDVITGRRSLFARKDFGANEVIAPFGSRKTYTHPSYLTVQVGETEHIELFPLHLECINHSCDPNCFFDTTALQLVALKPIKAGEEFGFFYPSAEWDMDQAFQCSCGTENCIGIIKGAKYLPAAALKTYRFTDFIKNKLRTEPAIAHSTLHVQKTPPFQSTTQL